MKGPTLTALRASIVLFSISTGVTLAPCIGVALIFDLLGDNFPALVFQTSSFLLASLVMLLLRWHAWQAYGSALAMHKVRAAEETGFLASIDIDCPHAWLVQLHLGLHGYRCRD
ncbi:hypothetical protein [Paraburkholderia sp.]|uniref:hypothetical protein n=1 Tax=Paraburkholderia sp. TaxID=1926495 RepID=UPI003D6E7B34